MVKYAKRRYSKRRGTARAGATKKVFVPKQSAPLTMSSLKRTVSKLILKKAEPKHFNVNWGKTEMYHNLINVKLLNDSVNMPAQGNGDAEREGDRINVSGFYLRIMCGQKIDRPNCTWKFWILRVPKGSNVAYTSLFDNTTGNILLDNVNTDRCKIIKQVKIHKFGIQPWSYTSGGSAVFNETTFPIKIWIPYKKLYKFTGDNAITHGDHDLYLVTGVYDAQGTLTTDNIGYIVTTHTMYYKDP